MLKYSILAIQASILSLASLFTLPLPSTNADGSSCMNSFLLWTPSEKERKQPKAPAVGDEGSILLEKKGWGTIGQRMEGRRLHET